MTEDTTKLTNVIQIDEAQVRGHLSELVRGSVEETLNGLLDAGLFMKMSFGDVMAMMKAIHAQESRAEALKKAAFVIDRLKQMKLRNAAALVAEGIEDTLSYYAFPPEHWRRIRTNNPLERIIREVRASRVQRAATSFEHRLLDPGGISPPEPTTPNPWSRRGSSALTAGPKKRGRSNAHDNGLEPMPLEGGLEPAPAGRLRRVGPSITSAASHAARPASADPSRIAAAHTTSLKQGAPHLAVAGRTTRSHSQS